MTDLEHEMLGYLLAKQRVVDAYDLIDRTCVQLAKSANEGGKNYCQLAVIRGRLEALIAAWDEQAVLSRPPRRERP